MIDIRGSIKAKTITPLHCWDVCAMFMKTPVGRLDKQEYQWLMEQQIKFLWQADIQQILETRFDALVLTDRALNISWVSSGFTAMTGYQRAEVMGKNPKMLQGNLTTEASKESIRSGFHSGNPFKAKVLNYRKNGEPYLCQLEIYPLLNQQKMLSHYLALEREIKQSV